MRIWSVNSSDGTIRLSRKIAVNIENLNPLPPSNAVRKQRKHILEDLFFSVLSKFEKYYPSENLKCNNLGNIQSLKLRNLMGKIF